MRHIGRHVRSSVLFVVLLTGTWMAVAADSHLDPRNSSDEFFEAQNGARCFSCHDLFQPMSVGLAERFSEVPVGEVQVVQVRVRSPSTMGHTVQNIAVTVNLSQAPNVEIVDDSYVADVDREEDLSLESGLEEKTAVNFSFGVKRLRVVLEAVGEETLGPLGLGDGALRLTLRSDATGRLYQGSGTRLQQVFERSGDEARDLGVGTFYINALWESEMDREMEVRVHTIVEYARVATEHRITLDGVKLRPLESTAVDVPIRFTSPGPALLDFRVESVSYWDHTTGSPAPRDDGLYYRFVTMKVLGGERVVKMESAFAPTPTAPVVDLYNLLARLIGFVTLVLVPVALVTGGVFGKGSRRGLNRLIGGPKRRVLWHMAMSWAIILLASLHLLLAVVEARFAWTKGLFWGGVGWALLVTLGFTGYYQSRIIKRWGYRPWRHVHLWPAVGVLLFGLAHAFLDGSDLAALRDLVPGSDRWSWP